MNWKKLLVFLGILLVIGFKFKPNNLNKKNKNFPKIRGVIMPHHDLVSQIFEKNFSKLSLETKPKTIVILGTNHFLPISPTFTATNEIKKKLQIDMLWTDDELVNKDHSIQTIVPYINKYFPNTEIIPILISSRYDSIKGLGDFVNSLTNKFDKNETIYLASVDFAHEVSLEEGINNNSESIKNISNFNYNNILKYDDKNMDSPIAITTLLLTMEKLGAKKWETWESSHGALVLNNIDTNSTSYVVGVFKEDLLLEKYN